MLNADTTLCTDDYLQIEVERTDGTALDDTQDMPRQPCHRPAAIQRRREEKEEEEGSAPQMIWKAKARFSIERGCRQQHYNINNVLVFESFHIKNGEWR